MKIIFGAGLGCIRYLAHHGPEDIEFIVDNSTLKQGEFIAGLPIYSPKKLNEGLKTGIQVVVTCSAEDEVLDQLLSLGVRRNSIIIADQQITLRPNQVIEKFSSELSLQVLEIASRVFSLFKVPYFLAYGTLLGAVREKSFINYDYDVDLWVFDSPDLRNSIDQIYQQIKLLLGDNSLCILKSQVDFPDNRLFETTQVALYKIQIISNIGTAYIDFFVLYQHDDYVYMTHDGNDLYRLPGYLFEQSLDYDFCGIGIIIPALYGSILHKIYGSWHEPVRPDLSSGKYTSHLHVVEDY